MDRVPGPRTDGSLKSPRCPMLDHNQDSETGNDVIILLRLVDFFAVFAAVSVLTAALSCFHLASKKEIPDVNESKGFNKGLIKRDKQHLICSVL